MLGMVAGTFSEIHRGVSKRIAGEPSSRSFEGSEQNQTTKTIGRAPRPGFSGYSP